MLSSFFRDLRSLKKAR